MQVFAQRNFAKGFSFPEVAHNEDAEEILQQFEIVEKDLNRELQTGEEPGKKMIANYINAAQTA